MPNFFYFWMADVPGFESRLTAGLLGKEDFVLQEARVAGLEGQSDIQLHYTSNPAEKYLFDEL